MTSVSPNATQGYATTQPTGAHQAVHFDKVDTTSTLTPAQTDGVNKMVGAIGVAAKEVVSGSVEPHFNTVIKTLEDHFGEVSHHGKITMKSLQAAADQPGASPDIVTAAKYLADNPAAFKFLDTADKHVHKAADGKIAMSDLVAAENNLGVRVSTGQTSPQAGSDITAETPGHTGESAWSRLGDVAKAAQTADNAAGTQPPDEGHASVPDGAAQREAGQV